MLLRLGSDSNSEPDDSCEVLVGVSESGFHSYTGWRIKKKDLNKIPRHFWEDSEKNFFLCHKHFYTKSLSSRWKLKLKIIKKKYKKSVLFFHIFQNIIQICDTNVFAPLKGEGGGYRYLSGTEPLFHFQMDSSFTS